MARPGLTGHRKFRRLARALGSSILARGVLELLWDSCYEHGDDYVGTATDIEAIVGWTGEPGMLTCALAAAGAPEGDGFIEPVPDRDDAGRYIATTSEMTASSAATIRYRVHDLWHHAPEYVVKRRQRELQRRERYRPSAKRRRTADSVRRLPTRESENGVTPVAVQPVAVQPVAGQSSSDSAASPDGAAPPTVVLTFPTIGPEGDAWHLTTDQLQKWSGLYPGLDVLGEARKALAWVQANRAKTVKGMPRFLVNWFNSAANRGIGRRGGSAQRMGTNTAGLEAFSAKAGRS